MANLTSHKVAKKNDLSQADDQVLAVPDKIPSEYFDLARIFALVVVENYLNEINT